MGNFLGKGAFPHPVELVAPHQQVSSLSVVIPALVGRMGLQWWAGCVVISGDGDRSVLDFGRPKYPGW